MCKDILVHLDGGDRDPARIAAAAGLARRFDARLTGLFARSENDWSATVARRVSDAWAAAAARSQGQFAALTAGLAQPGRWWRLEHGAQDHVLAETAAAARFHDLMVLGRHHDGKNAPDELIEQAVLQSGRPVLALPMVGEYPSIGVRVLAAWDGGREAARALHDALPILRRAEAVSVVTVRRSNHTPPAAAFLPPLDVIDHLAAHGVTAAREALRGDDIGVMDLLLSRACDLGADLLVMGGLGGAHGPFGKGGDTRFALRHLTLPTLIAH